MLRKLHFFSLIATLISAPVFAQMPIQPSFNAAIINGPTTMAIGIGAQGGNHELICGIDPESDWEAKQLAILNVAGQCGKARHVLDNEIEASTLVGSPQSTKSVQAPNASSRSLSFTPSQSNRRQNYANIVAKTRGADPTGADKMQQLFASTDVVAQIDQAIRPSGLRANNVADAYAVWWITAWEVANGRDMGMSARMAQAVKKQAADALLTTPQFASATNTQKQEMAEVFLIQAALIEASKDMFANDPTQLRALARAVNQGAMAMDRDLDLTKMTLTQDGFVPRNGGRSDASDPAADSTQLATNDEGAGNLALYAVAGTGLLAGVFALGKGLSKKG